MAILDKLSRVVDGDQLNDGWFNASPRSYEKLIEDYEEVQIFAQSFPQSSGSGYLYALEYFLKYNKLSPREALQLTDVEAKQALRKAILHKQQKGSYALYDRSAGK